MGKPIPILLWETQYQFSDATRPINQIFEHLQQLNNKMVQRITNDTDIAEFQQQWDDGIIYSSLWNAENRATFITHNWLPSNI